MSKRNIPLFVYGTLKRGFYNHGLIKDQDFVSAAKTEPGFIIYMNGVPEMVREGEKEVLGEFFKLDEKTFELVDRLEGHPIYYKRDIILIELEDGTKTKAWAYLRPNVHKGTKRTKDIEYV